MRKIYLFHIVHLLLHSCRTIMGNQAQNSGNDNNGIDRIADKVQDTAIIVSGNSIKTNDDGNVGTEIQSGFDDDKTGKLNYYYFFVCVLLLFAISMRWEIILLLFFFSNIVDFLNSHILCYKQQSFPTNVVELLLCCGIYYLLAMLSVWKLSIVCFPFNTQLCSDFLHTKTSVDIPDLTFLCLKIRHQSLRKSFFRNVSFKSRIWMVKNPECLKWEWVSTAHAFSTFCSVVKGVILKVQNCKLQRASRMSYILEINLD